MVQRSAGVLIHRRNPRGVIEVLLVHPGGPYWAKKDAGAWQIPKGQIDPGEDAQRAARREAEEELGVKLDGELIAIGALRQAGGKVVEAFAIERDLDAGAIRSNMFALEWPPGSGLMQSFPEVDAARWFSIEEARTMMLESQRPFLDRLEGAPA